MARILGKPLLGRVTTSQHQHPVKPSSITTLSDPSHFFFSTGRLNILNAAMDPIAREKLNAQLEDALQNKDIATFHRLLDAQTDLDENVNLHTLHRVATYNGVDTFRAVVERFPECKDYEFGHTGNAVGIATMSGDIELLKYLLDEVGHRANAGCWCYRPVRQHDPII